VDITGPLVHRLVSFFPYNSGARELAELQRLASNAAHGHDTLQDKLSEKPEYST